jgi:divinyl protochlorophyllide a 8-vinyl-reductase
MNLAAAPAAAGAAPSAAPARIGPNAILQGIEALRTVVGDEACAALLQRAGLDHHRLQPPAQMVDEADVVRLHQALRAELGLALARRVAWQAGTLTGNYLLAHRIPPLARRWLPRLPRALARRALCMAIGRHAWTFCGSGEFSVLPGRVLRLQIQGCAAARGAQASEPVCDFYAATFERLFRVLVDERLRAVEVACEAMGDDACVFELDRAAATAT